MNTFKPSGGFKRGGGGRSFDDRPKFGGNRGGNGGGRSFGDRPRRDEGGDRQKFQATCASCQKTCEVPFRPTGDKPVYCSDCFSKSRTDSRPAPSRDGRTTDRKSAAPAYDTAKIEQRLILIEGKLQRILELLQQPKDSDAHTVIKPKVTADTVGLKKAVAKAVKKPAAKKVAAKKVAKKTTKK